MDSNVPYITSVKNLHKILDAMQKAGVPDTFNLDFLIDLGFPSSSDRAVVKILKYIGFLDQSGRPQTSYREFVDHTKSKTVLAQRMRIAFDDLFVSDKAANSKTVEQLKGWFKSKTGAGDAVATKIASTFKTLAQYADFSKTPPVDKPDESKKIEAAAVGYKLHDRSDVEKTLGLVYRIEIHLPDTQNIETFRAIFRAIREELIS